MQYSMTNNKESRIRRIIWKWCLKCFVKFYMTHDKTATISKVISDSFELFMNYQTVHFIISSWSRSPIPLVFSVRPLHKPVCQTFHRSCKNVCVFQSFCLCPESFLQTEYTPLYAILLSLNSISKFKHSVWERSCSASVIQTTDN